MTSVSHTLSRRAFLGMPAAMVGLALSSCGAADEDAATPAEPEQRTARTVDEAYRSGALRVGLHSDNRPLSFLNTKGVYVGLDGYFSTYMGGSARIGIDPIAVDAQNRYDLLTTHEVDVCLAEMSPDDERSDEVLFGRPIYRLQLGLCSPTSASITSVEQLAEKELIVVEGTYAAQWARATWPEVTLRPYTTFTDSYVALQNGLGAAVLADEVSILGWLKGKSGFSLSMRGLSEPRYIAAAVAAGNEDMLGFIDDLTSDFISSGFSRTAYNKYVKTNITEDYGSMLCKNDELE